MRQNGEQASELLGEVHRFRPDRLGHHGQGKGGEGPGIQPASPVPVCLVPSGLPCLYLLIP